MWRRRMRLGRIHIEQPPCLESGMGDGFVCRWIHKYRRCVYCLPNSVLRRLELLVLASGASSTFYQTHQSNCLSLGRCIIKGPAVNTGR